MASKIIDNVWVGSVRDAELFAGGVMLCVLETLPLSVPQRAMHIPIMRNGKIRRTQLSIAADIIELYRERNAVLVFSGAGLERAPLAVVWFLHVKSRLTIEDAYELVQSTNPDIINIARRIATP